MHESWLAVLGDELETPHMTDLRSFLVAEVSAGQQFYPRRRPCLQRDGADAVRGRPRRHPRPGPVPRGRPGDGALLLRAPGRVVPPSLRNIYEELSNDLGVPRPTTGDLTPWAERGVLLLNAVLTVSPGKPASHAGKGWERFTDRAITELSTRRDGIVFLLWGKYAQDKGSRVDTGRHHVPPRPHGTRRRTA